LLFDSRSPYGLLLAFELFGCSFGCLLELALSLKFFQVCWGLRRVIYHNETFIIFLLLFGIFFVIIT
jgi:hypothetical protein